MQGSAVKKFGRMAGVRTLDALLFAQPPIRGAVYGGDQNLILRAVRLAERSPSRLHLLAVASPAATCMSQNGCEVSGANIIMDQGVKGIHTEFV